MTDVANMLARSAAYALRVQHQRAVEAMVVSDALRLRRPRWIRSPDSRLMHQYLANRGALDGVVPAEVLYGKPHAVPEPERALVSRRSGMTHEAAIDALARYISGGPTRSITRAVLEDGIAWLYTEKGALFGGMNPDDYRALAAERGLPELEPERTESDG